MQERNKGSMYQEYDEMEKLPKEIVEKLKGSKDWYKCYLSDGMKQNDKKIRGNYEEIIWK